jgi:dipeptidyl aminopeptidase/acylaminoacyl peptidase
MILRTVAILGLIVSLTLGAACAGSDAPKRPFTVKDSIEATQFLHPYGSSPVLISPDGNRYLVVLERGDVARNGAWVEFLSGDTASIKAARKARLVARLFSKSTVSAGDLAKNVRWLDDSEHVTFLWDDGEKPRRVLSVDVRNGAVETLAQYGTPIVEYDLSRDGGTMIFTAQGRHDPSEEASMERTGFAIGDQSMRSLLEGHFDGWSPGLYYDTFVRHLPNGPLSRVRESRRAWFTPPDLLRLSPDGRYAITVRPVGDVPTAWDDYTEHIFRDDYLPPARRSPGEPNLIRQYFVVDLGNATGRPLWNAPVKPPAHVMWSPDSKTLVIGPTFLPVPSASPDGLFGQAVAEVDPATGRFVLIPVPQNFRGSQFRPVRWTRDGILHLVGTGAQGSDSVRVRFKKIQGNWKQVADEPVEAEAASRVGIQVRADPNTPPALYAVDPATGAEALIEDPNLQLKGVRLGRVERVHWKAIDGRPWTGMLYYPVHYRTGRAFPLVIQTHGFSATQFEPDGSFTTVFAAQPLANHDIAVLQVGGPDGESEDFMVSPKEPEVYMAGFEGAIEHFVACGLVNREKVGIIGFSRTGWLVEYMLTHSRDRLAAAEVADNMDGSYLQYVTADDAAKSELDEDVGARPFGRGLETWMQSAPGFNADKIHTPLRMEVDSGPIDSILGPWEMFSNLRSLQKPVELFVIPNIRHGVHVLQNPLQRLASQGATVDWFCFWLKGEETADPTKATEYARWRRLKSLRQ